MVVPSFSMCLSNISDTAANAPITTGTTVTFFSFHNFLISSLRSWYFSIFSSSLSFTHTSPGMAMSMILASIACLSTKKMSGLQTSIFLSHCTLKSHRTLKPSFSTTCSGICLYHLSSTKVLPFHTVANAHTVRCCHGAPYIHVVPTCCTHMLDGLHFLLIIITIIITVIIIKCKRSF